MLDWLVGEALKGGLERAQPGRAFLLPNLRTTRFSSQDSAVWVVRFVRDVNSIEKAGGRWWLGGEAGPTTFYISTCVPSIVFSPNGGTVALTSTRGHDMRRYNKIGIPCSSSTLSGNRKYSSST